MRKPATRTTGFIVQAVTMGLVLSGCSSIGQQTKPTVSGSAAYETLYDGKSSVAYATHMPVGSAKEAEFLGDKALSEGDTDKALFEYTRALKKGGDDPGVLFKIGAIHAARGNMQLAELAFRWALKEDPDHVGALTGLGIALTKRRQYDAAAEQLNRAVDINPRNARAHNALGVIEDISRNYNSAQLHYQEALSIGGPSSSVLNNLGFSRYLSGDYQGAIDAFEDALKVNPKYTRAWRNLGLVYTRKGNYRQAVDAMAKVEDLSKAYNDVGYVAMIGGQLNDAETLFSEAMRLSPTYYQLAGANVARLDGIRASTGDGP